MKRILTQMGKGTAASYTRLQQGVPKLTTLEKRCLILQVYIHRCLNYRLNAFGLPQCDTFAKANNACLLHNLITTKTYERCKMVNTVGNVTKHEDAVKKLGQEFGNP